MAFDDCFYRCSYNYELCVLRKLLLPTEVDRDRGGELGHGARDGRDTETKCLSRLEPGVPIHLLGLDPPWFNLSLRPVCDCIIVFDANFVCFLYP